MQQALAKPGHLKLAFANSHLVNLALDDSTYAGVLRRFLVLPDGIGVDLGALIMHGRTFPANLNGTDFIPALLRATATPLRVGLVGARPGVAERAVIQLCRLAPQHRFVACSHGFFSPEEEPQLLARLEEGRFDLLLVAFGNPKQELWIAEHLDQRHARVAAGVGALFDFMAREVARAPQWLRWLRLEWLFRLAQEPSRLWRRYMFGNLRFVGHLLMQKWRGTPRSR
ncbi:MAG: WecB/TagA/CpsF family glycosyltransferase [Hyphomicrobiales bacterium]|nr:WecB/TagA/CpsF family glycosyltransferase [Hyphomicrobiales bacterium]